jgi:hypothetical protein
VPASTVCADVNATIPSPPVIKAPIRAKIFLVVFTIGVWT